MSLIHFYPLSLSLFEHLSLYPLKQLLPPSTQRQFHFAQCPIHWYNNDNLMTLLTIATLLFSLLIQHVEYNWNQTTYSVNSKTALCFASRVIFEKVGWGRLNWHACIYYSLINALKPGAIPSIGTHHSAFVKASISVWIQCQQPGTSKKKGGKRGIVSERYVQGRTSTWLVKRRRGDVKEAYLETRNEDLTRCRL